MDWSDAYPVALIALFAIGSLGTIARVGQPRKPLSGGDAMGIVVINVALIVGMILLWPWGGGV